MPMLLAAVTLVGIGAAALAYHRRHPQPFPVWLAGMLELSVRRWVLDAERMVSSLPLVEHARVLEVGPGGGAITGPLLRHRAAPALVCLDVQPGMLRKIRAKFGRGRMSPFLLAADAASLPLAAASLDAAVLVTVLGEIPDRAGALRECARVLKPEGLLAICETLPDPDFLPSSLVKAAAKQAGFVAVNAAAPVGTRVGTRGAYLLLFRRSPAA